MASGQTNEATWTFSGKSFLDVDMLDNLPIEIRISQSGFPDSLKLNIQLLSMNKISENLIDHSVEYLIKMFRLKDDLLSFYSEFNSDPISRAFKIFPGLRLMKAINLFESLICSITSQNSSVKKWNFSINSIKQKFGRCFKFPDGNEFFMFPKPKDLVRIGCEGLKKCKTGYRTEYIANVSKLICEGTLNLNLLKEKSYTEAYENLLEIKGIGPKVADCFCLYGLGFTEAAPVDRWTARIVSKLYFNGETVSEMEAKEFIQKRFGNWAGYAQLYLFHYARTVREPTPLHDDF
jgi:N-glycosylase/DNA lyase